MFADDSYKYISPSSIPSFVPVLQEWLLILDEYTRAHQGDDVAWWYNERASVSLLAGAVWRSGGIAFEEFCTEKTWSEGCESNRVDKFPGRCDLYFRLGSQDYYAEAKQAWSPAGRRAARQGPRIYGSLQEARLEAKKNEPYGGTRLGIVFAVPYLSMAYEAEIEQQIQDWIAEVKGIGCPTMAWSFPKETRHRARDDSSLYPGIALLIEPVE